MKKRSNILKFENVKNVFDIYLTNQEMQDLHAVRLFPDNELFDRIELFLVKVNNKPVHKRVDFYKNGCFVDAFINEKISPDNTVPFRFGGH